MRRNRAFKAVVQALTIAGTLVASSLVIPQSTHAQTSGRSIAPVGTLERMPKDAIGALGQAYVPASFFLPLDAGARNGAPENKTSGTLISIPGMRQIWQIFPHPVIANRTGVAVRDADTLALQKTFVVERRFRRATVAPDFAGDWMHSIDGNRRIFLAEEAGTEVLEIDLTTHAMRSILLPSPMVNDLPGIGRRANNIHRLGGITYDAYTDRVFLIFGVSRQGYVYLSSLDARPGATNPTVSPPRRVRSCAGIPASDISQTFSTTLLTRPDHIYFGCTTAGGGGLAIRIPRASLMDDTGPEDYLIGPVSIEGVLVDQQAGRMFFITILGEIWAFDIASMAFIGVVASGSEATSVVSRGYGLDPETGRLYFQSHTFGVGVTEGRFSPMPQARTLPAAKAPGQERIISNPRNGNFLVLTGNSTLKAYSYIVYRADSAPAPPAPSDPDRNTADLVEKEGVTERRHLANGGGYGARVILSRGVVTVLPAPNVGVLSPTAQVIAENINSKCGFTDRDLSAGRVLKAEYDHGATAAQAAAYEIDSNTKLDMGAPSRCDVNVKDTNRTERFQGIFSTAPQLGALEAFAPGWTMQGATCTSSAGEPTPPAKEGTNEGPAGNSRVVCPSPGEKLEAEGRGSLEGAVRVGKASTHVTIERPTTGGVRSTVVSLAQDINIAGVIHIAEVRSEATSFSNGRPSTAPLSSHKVTMRGVVIDTRPVCGDQCRIPDVIAALNTAAGGQAQFRMASGLDERLLKGTPKGASTAVQKSEARQSSDLALVGDFTTDVPGLEMIVYNDNRNYGRARQVYQFAGVSSVATYNIVLAPTGAGFGELTDEENGYDDLDVPEGAQPDGLGDELLGLDGEVAASDGGDGESQGFFGAVSDAIRRLARGIRLFLTSPRRALLLFTAWALFALPAALSRRRRLLAAARST